MKLLSWNVNGRINDAWRRQHDCVLDEAPDVLALQEVTLASHQAWAPALMTAGYSVTSSVDLVRLPYPAVEPPIRRKYFNLIAARGRIAALPGLAFGDPEQAKLAFPEKYLVVRVAIDGMEVDVHNAHLPPGSTRGTIKMHAFQAIRRRIDQPTNVPRVLCGDFNTPQSEDDEGMTTWASAHPEFRDEWDAAERAVLVHPILRDVYREQHQPGESYPASHFTRGTPRRYDHAFASPELETVRCRYMTQWLIDGLSDHAAVEAQLSLAS